MMFFIFKKDFLDLLEIVKEEIYKGHKLLSDPIMYNLENSENPYKSIAVSKDTFIDDGVQKKLIDGVISIAKKIPNRKNFSEFSENTLEEFRFIDLNLLTDGTKSFSY